MDSVFFVALRLSKYLINIFISLGILLLIFVYFFTLNTETTKNVVFDRDSSTNHDLLLNRLKSLGKDNTSKGNVGLLTV